MICKTIFGKGKKKYTSEGYSMYTCTVEKKKFLEVLYICWMVHDYLKFTCRQKESRGAQNTKLELSNL